MSKFSQNSFYQWLLVKQNSVEEEHIPEKSLPPKREPFKKPDPPRKRIRRRLTKSTQTVPYLKTKTILKNTQTQTESCCVHRNIIFISGIVFGIIFQKYIKII